MRRGIATSLLGIALLLAAALLGSVALFAFALGLQALVTGCLVATAIGTRRVVIERTVEQAEVLEGRPVTLRFAVRGLRASHHASTRRLKPMAALRAATMATTIHSTCQRSTTCVRAASSAPVSANGSANTEWLKRTNDA